MEEDAEWYLAECGGLRTQVVLRRVNVVENVAIKGQKAKSQNAVCVHSGGLVMAPAAEVTNAGDRPRRHEKEGRLNKETTTDILSAHHNVRASGLHPCSNSKYMTTANPPRECVKKRVPLRRRKPADGTLVLARPRSIDKSFLPEVVGHKLLLVFVDELYRSRPGETVRGLSQVGPGLGGHLQSSATNKTWKRVAERGKGT